MNTIELGSTGRRTTQLGFGCSGLLASMDRASSRRTLEAAFDAGIRHFDVAPLYGYGEAEGCLGEFLARFPGQCTVTTKFGIAAPARGRTLLGSARRLAAPLVRALPGLKRLLVQSAATFTGVPDKLPFTAAEARASLERSLRALRTERVDLFLLHEATAADLTHEDLLRFLEGAADEGKIGAFGIASTRTAARELTQARPALCQVVQTEWSPLDSFPAESRLCIFHRLFAESFQPLRSGLRAQPELCRRWSNAIGVDLSDAAVLASVLLKGALDVSPDALILFSSRRKEQLRANAAVADGPALQGPARGLHELVRTEGFPQPQHGQLRNQQQDQGHGHRRVA